MVNKKVLVCGGTGIATSVQVANKLQRMLRDRGITATMKECKTANVPAQMTTFQPDAIVVTTAITPPDEEIKVYRGTPLLTGVDAEELADQIANDRVGQGCGGARGQCSLVGDGAQGSLCHEVCRSAHV